MYDQDWMIIYEWLKHIYAKSPSPNPSLEPLLQLQIHVPDRSTNHNEVRLSQRLGRATWSNNPSAYLMYQTLGNSTQGCLLSRYFAYGVLYIWLVASMPTKPCLFACFVLFGTNISSLLPWLMYKKASSFCRALDLVVWVICNINLVVAVSGLGERKPIGMLHDLLTNPTRRSSPSSSSWYVPYTHWQKYLDTAQHVTNLTHTPPFSLHHFLPTTSA